MSCLKRRRLVSRPTVRIQMANQKKITINLLGSYSGNNKGDLAIVQAIVNNLIHKLPDIEIHIPSKNPPLLRKHLPKQGNISVYRTITAYLGPQSLKYLKHADCLIYGGGGLFFDRQLFNIFYNHIFNLFIVTLLNRLLFKKPIYLFSVGVSKLDNKLARFMTKFILRNADHISVRDEPSRRIFSEITDKKIHLRYDPAFLLKPKPNEEINRFAQQFTQEKTLLICLNQAAKKSLSELAKLVERFAKDHNVILYQNLRKQTTADLLWKKLSERENIHKMDLNPYSPSEIIYLFTKADYIVSFPMHGGIFAYLAGKPAALVDYDPKVRELGRIIGNELAVKPEELGRLAPEMIKEQGVAKKPLGEVRERSLRNFTDLKRFLE